MVVSDQENASKAAYEQAEAPAQIRVSKACDLLVLMYQDGQSFELTAEYLRVLSPSAEVQGHGPGQEVTQFGKRNVLISNITPVGRYAIRIHFSDGHDSGLYHWSYLKELAMEYETKWNDYLEKLTQQDLSR